MNQYGTRAKAHWKTHRPSSYSQLTDPDRFFAEMGERAASQVARLAEQLAGPDQTGEEYLAKVGRLNNARMRAEEIVLPEEVLAAPEPDQDSDPSDDPGRESSEDSAQRSTGWIPSTVDPNHPYWATQLQAEADAAEATRTYQEMLARRRPGAR